jgi:hypothetical protein
VDDKTPLWDVLDAGRHALDEDVLMTPIFAALTRGGWRQRQRADTAQERFRRDPLTAPIPVVSGIGPVPEGRHHRRRQPLSHVA